MPHSAHPTAYQQFQPHHLHMGICEKKKTFLARNMKESVDSADTHDIMVGRNVLFGGQKTHDPIHGAVDMRDSVLYWMTRE